MSPQQQGPRAPSTIRIITKCSSIDELASRYGVMVDPESIFVVPPKPLPPGSRRRFTVLLADGTAALDGVGEVVPGVARLGDKTGIRLRFVELGAVSRRVLAALLAAKQRARRTSTLPPVSLSAVMPAQPLPPAPAAPARAGTIGHKTLPPPFHRPPAPRVSVITAAHAPVDDPPAVAEPTPAPSDAPPAAVPAVEAIPSELVVPLVAAPDRSGIHPRRSRRVVVAVGAIAIVVLVVGGAFALGNLGGAETPDEDVAVVAAPHPIESVAAPPPVEPVEAVEPPVEVAAVALPEPAAEPRAEPAPVRKVVRKAVRKSTSSHGPSKKAQKAPQKAPKKAPRARAATPPPRPARVATGDPQLVRLSLASSPPGATFQVNGENLGRGTTHALVRSSSTVKVTAVMRGYKRTTRTIRVGRNASLLIPLEPMGWRR